MHDANGISDKSTPTTNTKSAILREFKPKKYSYGKHSPNNIKSGLIKHSSFFFSINSSFYYIFSLFSSYYIVGFCFRIYLNLSNGTSSLCVKHFAERK